MSVRAMTWAFEQPLPPAQKLVLLVLADCYNDERGMCFPATDYIIGRASVSRATLFRIFNELEMGGYMTREERHSREGRQLSTIYRLPVGVDVRRLPPLPGGGSQIETVGEGLTGETPGGLNGETPYEPKQEPKVTTGKTRARGCRLPENWEPCPDVASKGLSTLGRERYEQELEKFRNYWASKPGKDALKLDWNKTFSNWIITAAQSAPRRPTYDTATTGAQRTDPPGSNLTRIFDKLYSAIEGMPDEGGAGDGGYSPRLSTGRR